MIVAGTGRRAGARSPRVLGSRAVGLRGLGSRAVGPRVLGSRAVGPAVVAVLVSLLACVGCAADGPTAEARDSAAAPAAVAAPAPAVPAPGEPVSAPGEAVPAPGEGAPAQPGPTPPGGARGLPAGVPEPPAGTNQLVTVLVGGAGATSGELRAWQRAADGSWASVQGPVRVKVGTAGVGQASEGVNRTPRGTFPLAEAFGRQANPGSKLPYRKVGNTDWWVSDTRSAAYNTHQTCAPGSCAFDEDAGENLGQAGPSYDYAAVIGYNAAPVRKGAGSAFFLHVDAGVPSAGCVVVPRASVVTLLRWLDAAQKPRITIGYA